jgi:predicted CoA-binding protein
MSHALPPGLLARLHRRGPETRIAVVGASNDPNKYGNIIVRDLARSGYTVLPVNPHATEIAGLRCYANVAEVPDPVHIVDMVTPPRMTDIVLSELEPAKTEFVFLQDGSWDESTLTLAQQKFPAVIHHACIMVLARTA